MTKAARRTLLEDGFPKKVGRCQEWARLTYQLVYGHKFDFAWRPTAKEAAAAFKNTKYDVTGQTPKPGDLKYQWGAGHSPEGHVGIQLERGMTAQNGSKTNDGQDARGILSDNEFGDYDLLVRLS